jgi:hypothetical protein
VRPLEPASGEAARQAPGEHQGVAVFIEVLGHGATVSRELVGKARQLAAKLNTRVVGLLLGDRVDHIAAGGYRLWLRRSPCN